MLEKLPDHSCPYPWLLKLVYLNCANAAKEKEGEGSMWLFNDGSVHGIEWRSVQARLLESIVKTYLSQGETARTKAERLSRGKL